MPTEEETRLGKYPPPVPPLTTSWWTNAWQFKPITRKIDYEAEYTPFREIFYGRDDEGYLKKTAIMSRHTILLAGFMTLGDICLHPTPTEPPTGAALALAKIKKWAVPIVGCGLTYTTMVNVSANVRKKDDQWNHAIAGMSVGLVLGKATKSFLTGTLTGLLFALLGHTSKDSIIHNYGFFGHYPKWKQYGNSMSHFHDHTVKPDRPGYWVRQESEIPAMMKRGQV